MTGQSRSLNALTFSHREWLVCLQSLLMAPWVKQAFTNAQPIASLKLSNMLLGSWQELLTCELYCSIFLVSKKNIKIPMKHFSLGPYCALLGSSVNLPGHVGSVINLICTEAPAKQPEGAGYCRAVMPKPPQPDQYGWCS